jgi:hypothetical protein
MLKIWHNVFYKPRNSSLRKYFDLERGGGSPDMMGSLKEVVIETPPEFESKNVPEHTHHQKKEVAKKKESEAELSAELKKDVENILQIFLIYEKSPNEFAVALKQNKLCNLLDVLQKYPSVAHFVGVRLEENGKTMDHLVELLKQSEQDFDRQKFNELSTKIQNFGNNFEYNMQWLNEFYTQESRQLLEQGLQFSPYLSLVGISTILKLEPGTKDEREMQQKYYALAVEKILTGDSLEVIRGEITNAQSFLRKVEIEDVYKTSMSVAEIRNEKVKSRLNEDVDNAILPLVQKFITQNVNGERQKTFDLMGRYCVKSKDSEWSRILLNQMCVYNLNDETRFIELVRSMDAFNVGFHEVKALVESWDLFGDAEPADFLARLKSVIDKQKTHTKLKSENFDFEKCLPKWEQNFYSDPDPDKPDPEKRKEERVKKYVAHNVKTMLDLENRTPGICKHLARTCGILNYGRYAPAMLTEQYKTEKEQKRYGIILNPYDDHNGACSGEVDILNELSGELKAKGVLLRVVEAGGKAGIAKRLLKLDKKYGKHNKIECAVIGAHGTTKSMIFGKMDVLPEDFGLGSQSIEGLSFKEKIKRFFFEEKNIEPTNLNERGKNEVFQQSDLEGRGVRKISKVFADCPSVLLSSCSTGKERGVGQNLSRTFGVEISAPMEDSVLKKIVVDQDEKGRIHLRGEFTNPEQIPIKTAHYVKGKKKPLPKA